MHLAWVTFVPTIMPLLSFFGCISRAEIFTSERTQRALLSSSSSSSSVLIPRNVFNVTAFKNFCFGVSCFLSEGGFTSFFS
jgi:hypothetical protein